MKQKNQSNLKKIALHLESLEEKIIFNLLNRAQYKQNNNIYKNQSNIFLKKNQSLLNVRLKMQENIDAKFGRYTVPEERPFNSKLAKPLRKFNSKKKSVLKIKDFNIVNMTLEIKKGYLRFIPSLCAKGDDVHHGSSIEHDVCILQAIAERVHFGSFYVAEAKYQATPLKYQLLIEEKNQAAIWKALTRSSIEKQILKRIKEKVNHYQKGLNKNIRYKVNPNTIVKLYKEVIIPATKNGQILYFMNRHDE